MTQTPEERREKQRLAAKAYREKRKAAGNPVKGKPGKISGGKAAAAERMRRYRQRKKSAPLCGAD